MKQSHMDKFAPLVQAILLEKQGPCFSQLLSYALKSAAVGNNSKYNPYKSTRKHARYTRVMTI